MVHPNNTTFQIDDLFDNDLWVIYRFMMTLEMLKLAPPECATYIYVEIVHREETSIGER